MIKTLMNIGASISIGVGSGALVGNLVSKLTPSELSKFTDICVKLTGMVGTVAVANYLNNVWNGEVEAIEKLYKSIKKNHEAKKEIRKAKKEAEKEA